MMSLCITCHISSDLEILGQDQIGIGIVQVAISQEPLKMQICDSVLLAVFHMTLKIGQGQIGKFFSIGCISVTTNDTDLGLITKRDDVIAYYLPYIPDDLETLGQGQIRLENFELAIFQ